MRINVYAEELPNYERSTELTMKAAETGTTFYGVRIFLESPNTLHYRDGDDDRSAITFWGPRTRVAQLLREAADLMDPPAERK